MKKYNIISENPESTVVAEYHSEYNQDAHYESEAELEKNFINMLQEQAYEYLPIHTEEELIANLRKQLELLNEYQFSDTEWSQFFKSTLASSNKSIFEKTKMVQEDYILVLKRDNGEDKNIRILDKDFIHNNRLQVINQYTPQGGQRENRYDVTVLVNGLPMVHIELKRRGVAIQEAFNQIKRYDRESFWAGSGLFEYIQLFVISNGTQTKYYSNTTRKRHITEMATGDESRKGPKTSNSFEFTSWWADAQNEPILDLIDFTKTFFAKHSLLNLLVKYCVFTTDQSLMVMRPYQIVAAERILNRIHIAYENKLQGSIEAGGYIWHTTGSGKTLTSFKTSQMASKLAYTDKVLFVVDRKDLDYQTMKEYDKFAKGSANSNTSTRVLQKQLEDPNARIIITTIQKLSVFIKKNKSHPIYGKQIVMIFDECHRSQFGDMHQLITQYFKNYYLYGFTGTPIFATNSTATSKNQLKTTEQAFGQKLHTYTIVNAIADKNVLPFRVEYISTMREKEKIADEAVYDIDREKALMAPERIENISRYIFERNGKKTKRTGESYIFDHLKNVKALASAKNQDEVKEEKEKIRVKGFNSIFCVSSIPAAIAYYKMFKKVNEEMPSDKQLKFATIFSYSVNDVLPDDLEMEDENSESTEGLDHSQRDFLERAIKDYNAMFKTNYDTSAEKFQNYYKDVSLRVKNRELDILIVVNMFLTGFDATTLNTLWVDKNLRMHGLLQAFSRTNRILNSVKTFGNIVCFRDLEEATNKCLALFGDKNAQGTVLLLPYEDYYEGYIDEKGKAHSGYKELVDELLEDFPLDKNLISEEEKKRFIALYNTILKLQNILSTFDQFDGNEVLTPREFQNYQSRYIDLYKELRPAKKGDAENVNDDIIFEMELIKQVEINIDYILQLIILYHDENMKNKELLVTINTAVNSSLELRNKKDLIEQFIAQLNPDTRVDDDWRAFVEERKRQELDLIIQEHQLHREATFRYMHNAFRDGYIQIDGLAISSVLPPVPRFTPDSQRAEIREEVVSRFQQYFAKYWDISGDEF